MPSQKQGNSRNEVLEPQFERSDTIRFFNQGEVIMGKSQDSKKEAKKEPAKTTKEKKAAKKVKKEEKKRQ